jgi:hypothetical protein
MNNHKGYKEFKRKGENGEEGRRKQSVRELR